MSDDEIEIIALLARYHRKSGPKARHPEFARLSNDDQRLVRALSGILRVAIGLDRSHARRVAATRCHLDGDLLVIEVIPDGDAGIELELFTAEQRRELLEEGHRPHCSPRRGWLTARARRGGVLPPGDECTEWPGNRVDP